MHLSNEQHIAVKTGCMGTLRGCSLTASHSICETFKLAQQVRSVVAITYLPVTFTIQHRGAIADNSKKLQDWLSFARASERVLF